MQLSSPAFADNRLIPAKYTCKGTNISPPLQVKGVPEGSKSLALVVHDPDAPNGDWLHWTVWNIAPATTDIPENSLPPGAVQGKTDFGRSGYGGPCPPSSTHRYIFELIALDAMLELKSGATRQELDDVMEDHILAAASLTGLFSAN